MYNCFGKEYRKMIYAYVSIWSHGERNGGLALYKFHPGNGSFSRIKTLDEKTEFSVSTIDRKKGILYALDESSKLPDLRTGGGGRLFAFRLDPATGEAKQISCVPTCCPNPSYVTMDKTGKYLVVSNHAGSACVTKLQRDAFGKIHLGLEFDDSAVELFAVEEDGKVGDMLDFIIHKGSGPDPKFQMTSHPHCAVMSPDGRFFTVCDKGNDGVYMYKIDQQENKLVSLGPAYACLPGSRPRYCVYHPTRPYLFTNNEGRPEVDAFHYDENGHLTLIDSYSIQTEENETITGEWVQQDFRVDAVGHYLYTLVAADSALIAVLKVDQESGALTLVQNLKLNEKRPRGCTLSPDGRFLLVACAGSGAILTLAIDENGKLAETGFRIEEPDAAFITLYQP